MYMHSILNISDNKNVCNQLELGKDLSFLLWLIMIYLWLITINHCYLQDLITNWITFVAFNSSISIYPVAVQSNIQCKFQLKQCKQSK